MVIEYKYHSHTGKRLLTDEEKCQRKIEGNKKYSAKNRDKILKAQTKYREKHREEIRAKQNKYYQDNIEKEREQKRQYYHDFLQSDFSLYKGGQVFSPAYELLDLYKGCIMSQDTNPTSNNTNPTDNCAIGKMNGYQYKLSICARQSLDAIKGKPVSISSLPDEALKSLYGIEDKPQRNDCGF